MAVDPTRSDRKVPQAVGSLALNGPVSGKMPNCPHMNGPRVPPHHSDPMKPTPSLCHMSARWWLALGLCVGLAGCGPDTVGAAATAAKLQADSAERAQAQAAKLKQDLEAAVKAREASTAAADQ